MIIIPKLSRISFGYPSKWQGKSISNHDISIHYRYGKFSVKVNDKEILFKPIGHSFDGQLSNDQMIENIKNIIKVEEIVDE